MPHARGRRPVLVKSQRVRRPSWVDGLSLAFESNKFSAASADRSARHVGLVARIMTGLPGSLASLFSPVRHQPEAPDWRGCVKLVAGPRYQFRASRLARRKFLGHSQALLDGCDFARAGFFLAPRTLMRQLSMTSRPTHARQPKKGIYLATYPRASAILVALAAEPRAWGYARFGARHGQPVPPAGY
jgi:hypothetical protein